MRDYTEEEWRNERPYDIEAEDAVDYCLHNIFADGRKRGEDKVIGDLTYAELIATLLLAQDVITEHRDCYL